MSRETFDIDAALEKCHAGTAWQRDLIHAQLIAAALTAADVFELSAQFEDEKNAVEELRESCARALAGPDEWRPIETAPKDVEVQFPIPDKTLYGPDRTVSGHF